MKWVSNHCLLGNLLWCKAWDVFKKFDTYCPFPNWFHQPVCLHTQLFGRCQNNVGKSNNTVYQNTAQRVATYIKYWYCNIQGNVWLFFLFTSWSYCSLHFIKIYYVIFHIFYNWKAIKNTITINTHTTNSFLKELVFLIFSFYKTFIEKKCSHIKHWLHLGVWYFKSCSKKQ